VVLFLEAVLSFTSAKTEFPKKAPVTGTLIASLHDNLIHQTTAALAFEVTGGSYLTGL